MLELFHNLSFPKQAVKFIFVQGSLPETSSEGNRFLIGAKKETNGAEGREVDGNYDWRGKKVRFQVRSNGFELPKDL